MNGVRVPDDLQTNLIAVAGVHVDLDVGEAPSAQPKLDHLQVQNLAVRSRPGVRSVAVYFLNLLTEQPPRGVEVMYGGIDQYRLRARAWKDTGVSVHPLEQDGVADGSGVDGRFYVEVLGIVTPHKPDLNYFFAQLDLGVDDPARVLCGGGNRFLAEERLLVSQAP